MAGTCVDGPESDQTAGRLIQGRLRDEREDSGRTRDDRVSDPRQGGRCLESRRRELGGAAALKIADGAQGLVRTGIEIQGRAPRGSLLILAPALTQAIFTF